MNVQTSISSRGKPASEPDRPAADELWDPGRITSRPRVSVSSSGTGRLPTGGRACQRDGAGRPGSGGSPRSPRQPFPRARSSVSHFLHRAPSRSERQKGVFAPHGKCPSTARYNARPHWALRAISGQPGRMCAAAFDPQPTPNPRPQEGKGSGCEGRPDEVAGWGPGKKKRR